jgi:hypothetical protein
MAQILLTGTWAADDTLTVTVGGVSFTHTAASATLSEIATGATAALNADPSLSSMIDAYATGASLYLISKDFFTPYSIAEAVVTAGDGDAAVQNSLSVLTPNQSIGTIDTSGVNDALNQLTIASAASISGGVGVPIGVVSTPLGMLGTGLDMTYDPPEQGLYTSGSVYGDRLPYWDGELARLFPEITRV